MKLTKLIYLASPYSDEDLMVMHLRALQIDSIMSHMYSKTKVSIIPPILISRIIKDNLGENIGTSFKDWKQIDLTYISKCDEVWVACMNGWIKSIGVQAEIKFAEERNIKVRYINPTTMRFIKCPLKKLKKQKA